MVRNYGFLVCIVVIVMDVVAGILGIQAEIAQNKVLLSWTLLLIDKSYMLSELRIELLIIGEGFEDVGACL